MTDLTEKWEKGELEPAYYYVRIQDGSIMNIFFDENNIVDINGWEVLGAVPSYDEWQRIFHYAGKYEYEYTSCVMDYENLKQEKQQLKELLKECYKMLAQYHVENSEPSLDENIELLTKIDNEIGEKK